MYLVKSIKDRVILAIVSVRILIIIYELNFFRK